MNKSQLDQNKVKSILTNSQKISHSPETLKDKKDSYFRKSVTRVFYGAVKNSYFEIFSESAVFLR